MLLSVRFLDLIRENVWFTWFWSFLKSIFTQSFHHLLVPFSHTPTIFILFISLLLEQLFSFPIAFHVCQINIVIHSSSPFDLIRKHAVYASADSSCFFVPQSKASTPCVTSNPFFKPVYPVQKYMYPRYVTSSHIPRQAAYRFYPWMNCRTDKRTGK